MPPALVDALADLTAAQAVFGAVALFAASLVPWFLLVDSRWLHQLIVHAGHDINHAIATAERLAKQTARETALTVAALLILTIPNGDLR